MAAPKMRLEAALTILPDHPASDEPPGPPLLPPEEQLRHLGWPPNAPWMAALTIDPFSPDGRGAIRVTQYAAPPYITEWEAGPAWAGYHLYQLALMAPRVGGGVALRWIYLRLWLPGRAWYGAMEEHRGQPPEQSLRGAALTVLTLEQRLLLDVLRTCTPPRADYEDERRQLALEAAGLIEAGYKLNRENLAAAFFINPTSLDDKMRRAGVRGIRALKATPLAELKLGRINRK